VGAFGEVQVMDWGLAKVLGDQGQKPQPGDFDPDATAGWQTEIGTPEFDGSATRTGSVLGTLAYMAPEQAGGEIRKLDARSDVFGLGAILCQILTGRPPYSAKDAQALRLQAIRGEMTDAMSRLDSCVAEPELVALCRRCLASEQQERPADGLAVAAAVAGIRQAAETRARQAELQRERTLVQAAEQTRRRRLALGAGLAIVAVLVAGLVASLYQMQRANQERDAKAVALEAEQKATNEAVLATALEKVARQQAQKRLAQIEKGVELFAGMLTGINPRAEEKGGDPLYVQLRRKAENAAAELEGEVVGEPQAVARLQTILGNTLRELGNYPAAVALLEKARLTRQRELGAEHPDTLATLNSLASAYQADGKLPEAIKLYEQVKDAKVAKLGADHPSTLNTLINLAAAYRDAGKLTEAIKLYEQVRVAQVAKLGADHHHTLAMLNNLAVAYQTAGKLPEAIKLFEQVRDAAVAKLGADHPDTLATLNSLARAYHDAGKVPQAIKLYEQVKDARVAKLGADHPSTLTTLNNLAGAYYATGKLPQAIKLLEQVKDAEVAKLGAEHPSTLITLNNLAGAYQTAGKLSEAIKLYEQVKAAQVAKLGADHPATLTTLNNLASAYQIAGRGAEALPLFEQAATGIEKRQFQHQHAGRIVPNTVRAYEAARQLDRAEAWQRRWLAAVKDKAGPLSPAYAREMAGLGLLLLKQEKWTDAEAALKHCLVLRQKTQLQAWTTFNTMSILGAALLGQKKYAAAEPLLLKGYEGVKQREKTIPPPFRKARLTEAIERLLQLYEALEKKDEASKWRKELEALKK
jgi:uncharacterized protein YjgD (DUF1641 family)